MPHNQAMASDDALERRGEVVALWLLLIGGIILPVLGWIIGVVILWASERWTRRDKLIGTLVVPGGLLLPLAVLVYYYLGAGWGACPSETAEQCVYGMTGRSAAAIVIGLSAFSIGSIIYLARRRHEGTFSEHREPANAVQID